jgi:uracil-DNA glycosylase
MTFAKCFINMVVPFNMDLPKNLTVVKGDILTSSRQIIAQQCNCTSKTYAGLSKSIVDTFPHANFYNRDFDSKPGTIKLVGKKSQRYIVAMFAQLRPGKPKQDDTAEMRIEWFKSCLGKIAKIKGIKSIAFPYGIGCGLAGGDWQTYCKILVDWAKCHDNIQIDIVKIKSTKPKKDKPVVSQSELEKLFRSERIFDHAKIDKIREIREMDKNFDDWLIDYARNSPVFCEIFKRISTLEKSLSKSSHAISQDITHDTKCNTRYDASCSDVPEHDDEFNHPSFLRGSMPKAPTPKASVPQPKKSDQPADQMTWENSSLQDWVDSGVPDGWEEFFDKMQSKGVIQPISDFLKSEAKTHNIYPPLQDVFAAFEYCKPKELKVVILGQDPYHSPGAAVGLAFSHPPGQKNIQPSLKWIYECMKSDKLRPGKNGDLSKWAGQGVFLINTALTVRQGEPESHATKYGGPKGIWHTFMISLLSWLDKKIDRLVVICWGSKAKEYNIFSDAHYKISSYHPAACFRNEDWKRDFLNHRPFSKANSRLKQWNKPEIDWNLS